jgi:phospholipase/carboxylesterase
MRPLIDLMPLLTRRQIVLGSAGMAAFGCRSASLDRSLAPARLAAKPQAPTVTIEPGEHRVGGEGPRSAILHAPRDLPAHNPVPLLVMLHGANGSAARMRFAFEHADRVRAVVLAPDSRGRTWDVLEGGFGPDVGFIDAALTETFSRVRVDPGRVTIGGFSDGASYALSLGLANGHLFSRIIAFSPGFASPPEREGTPNVFISHGRRDRVLDIDGTSRIIVRRLRTAGYTVIYEEFDGGHMVPAEIARRAFDWAAG